MSNDAILSKTEIVIQGYKNSQPVVFSNLLLDESFISVNHFSFSIRADDDQATLDSIIRFKKDILGKELQIEFKDGSGALQHRFKGLIREVNSSLADEHNYEFQIKGSGLFCKVDKVPEFHSFYKQTLSNIIEKAYKDSGIKPAVKNNPAFSSELLYMVQYNQTLFGFTTALAMRFGEWMHYDGEHLVFGKKPEGAAVELNAPDDVYNLNIHAHMFRNPIDAVGTDSYKGETIKAAREAEAPGSPILQATGNAGKKALETWGHHFAGSGFNQSHIERMFRIEQQAGYARSAAITGDTRNNRLSIGKIIKIKDRDDSGGKHFIITDIHHHCTQPDHYHNSFTAIPAEAEVPPYTNAGIAPLANSQLAVVTDNVDDAGMARVKVRFSWMKEDEKTPWISVLVPHAGKDKGFRFLPEIDDEVMVQFTDGNAELPYVMGAIYTEKHKPGVPEKDNNIKRIGTKTGRRLEMNDKEGEMILADDFKDMVGNRVFMMKTEGQKILQISSGKDEANLSVVFLDGNRGRVTLGVKSGNTVILQIDMQQDGKVMDIISAGTINIKADQTINLEADEIHMKARHIGVKAKVQLDLEGKTSAGLSGEMVKVDAGTSLDLKASAQATLAGAMLDLKGDGIASLTGALVKIN
ncbi:type VI secretion system Vgr family protein [Niabella aurantiaca]|uniref:type VI secretion system Vgr family protein n=1 Tax=Niabella aurantiaca TaxID=379900 RepID=UPI00037FADC1|nr:phage baseplate assembly protein V [Niabella aurantiaca]